jgi:hypothetical protein
MKEIIMVLSGLIGGILFVIIKNKIFSQTKKELIKIIPEEDKNKIKELYEKGLVPEKVYKEVCSVPEPTECFNKEKAITGLTNITNKVLWMKDMASIFNLRKLIIIGVILGVVFGYGWFKGRQGAPVHFDMRGKEATIQLNEHYLKIEKDGTAKVIDKYGKVLKTIRVKDIPELERALRPFGFIIEPIVVAGGSIGETGAGVEAGGGISWFKWYRSKLDAFITSKGVYPLGVSYSITDRSGMGLGMGFGYKGDRRIIFYYKWRF